MILPQSLGFWPNHGGGEEPLPSSLITHLDFLDGFNSSTGIWTDLSGNGYDGIPASGYAEIGEDYAVITESSNVRINFDVATLAPSEYTEIVVVEIPNYDTSTYGTISGELYGIICSYGIAVEYGSGCKINYYSNDLDFIGEVGGRISFPNIRGRKAVIARSYNGADAAFWANLQKTVFTANPAWDGTYKLWGSRPLVAMVLKEPGHGGRAFPGIRYSHVECYGARLTDSVIESRISALMNKYGLT